MKRWYHIVLLACVCLGGAVYGDDRGEAPSIVEPVHARIIADVANPQPDDIYDIEIPWDSVPELRDLILADGGRIAAPAAPPKWTWAGDQQSILANALRLRSELLRVVRARREQIDPEQFQLETEKDLLYFNDALGRAQLNTVNGVMFQRVADRQSELSVLFLDADQTSPTSTHLHRIIARQHIDAGRSRADHQYGRDVVLVWTREGRVEKTEFLPRYRFFTPAWWKDWAIASWHRPAWGAVKLAGICIVAQAALAFGVCGVKYFSTNADFHAGNVSWYEALGQIDRLPAELAAVWGGVIGIIAKSYIEVMRRGPKTWQWVKNFVVGASFAYTLKALEGHGADIIGIFTAAGIILHASVVSNVALNQWAKVYWNQITNIRKEERENMNLNRLPGKRDPNEIDPDALHNQLMYLPTFTIRLFDLVGVPLGKALLAGSIPFIQWLAVKLFEGKMANASTEAEREKWRIRVEELRKEWNESIWRRPDKWIADRISALARRIAGAAGYVRGKIDRCIAGVIDGDVFDGFDPNNYPGW